MGTSTVSPPARVIRAWLPWATYRRPRMTDPSVNSTTVDAGAHGGLGFLRGHKRQNVLRAERYVSFLGGDGQPVGRQRRQRAGQRCGRRAFAPRTEGVAEINKIVRERRLFMELFTTLGGEASEVLFDHVAIMRGEVAADLLHRLVRVPWAAGCPSRFRNRYLSWSRCPGPCRP